MVLVASLIVGRGIGADLHNSDLQIPGTGGSAAAALSESRFGNTVSMAVLLKGPPRVLDRRGPGLVRELEGIAGVQVLSPWAPGGRQTVDGRRDRALLLIQVSKPFQRISDETVPQVRALLADRVEPPLESHLTGFAPLVKEINQVGIDAIERGELIALPVLVVLLLLVFRSPLAAAIPAVCGFLVTEVGGALVASLSTLIEVDALALNLVAMMGLALGVDYSLLTVSRFREELDGGADALSAARTAATRAGRTVVFAGAALALGMVVALLIAPGSLLVSAATGMLVVTVVAVLAATTAIPAALVLLGGRVDALSFGRRGRGGGFWIGLSRRALAQPGIAALLVSLPLLLVAVPAVAVNTGPPDVKNLPSDDAVRKDFEAIERELGSGWTAPFEVVVDAGSGRVTSRTRLRALDRFQAGTARNPEVAAVFGPATIGRRTQPLVDLARGLPSDFARGDRNLRRLARGLLDASHGMRRLRRGLASAANGSGELASGSESALQGATALSQGIGQAGAGGNTLVGGLARAESGARKLKRGSADAVGAAGKFEAPAEDLAGELDKANGQASTDLGEPIGGAQTEIQNARNAISSLSAAARAEPGAQRAIDALAQAATELNSAESALSDTEAKLSAGATGANELARGLRQLRTGLESLDAGAAQLSSSGPSGEGLGTLSSGAQLLGGETGSLVNGLGEISGGAGRLRDGLGTGVTESAALRAGLGLLRAGVVRYRGANMGAQADLRASGTDLTRAAESGYFVLAGIEGTPFQARTNSDFAINAARGGNTGRIFIVPRTGLFEAATSDLHRQLDRSARDLGDAADARAVVGGPAAVLDDFDRITGSRFPWLILALVLTTILVLIVVFRSPVLAAVAVLLNLLTVGAALGVMTVAFQGDAPLGGPGYLDAISLSGIVAVIFGLSIDYEVFLIARIVEGRRLTGTTDGAIEYGLKHTAGIITGAAAIMTGVFLAFAISDVGNTRQFGVGLTVAVILDATVVRLVLLPALIRLAGERTWWIPGWLARVLPDRLSAS